MKLQAARYDTFRQQWDPPLDPRLDSESTVLFVFGDIGQKEMRDVVAMLCGKYPKAAKIGCSTAGEIFGESVLLEGLVVAVARLERTRIRQVVVPITSPAESTMVGTALGKALRKEDLKGVFVLSEGLAVNGSELAEGLRRELGDEIPVSGGLAGDYERFAATYVLEECAPKKGRISAIGFYGDVFRMTSACRGGWRMYSEPMRITGARGNVLVELDGRPALDVYKELMGEDAAGLPAKGLLYPLAVKRTRGGFDEKVRTVLAVSELTKTVTFAGEIPEGGWAIPMRSDPVGLEEAARDAAALMSEGFDVSGPALCLAVSCVGRRLLLGGNTPRELLAVSSNLPEESVVVGFYSYGELSPGYDGRCDLHNQTIALTLIGEDGDG